jgi:NTP pyrophosphatase (non-canonical NTP hydrolase)
MRPTLLEGMEMPLSFREFSQENRWRCESSAGFNHLLWSWSLSDWMTATLGELGEAANVAKKLNRIRDGVPGNGDATEAELKKQLAHEIADTFIYLDLLTQAAGFDVEDIVREKFNLTSKKIGWAIQI